NIKMKTTFNSKIFFVAIFLFVSTISCRKRDAILPDNLVVFETSSQGIASNENAITIKLKLSHGADRDIPLVISLNEQGVVYTTEYTTNPAAVAGKINLTIPSGN